MNTVIEQLSRIGIVPVIAIDDAEKAVPLAKALVAGGLPAAEVTFRTAAGEEAIRRIAAEVPEMLVGAGTVLSTQQVDEAKAAGAQFVVTPGMDPDIVAYCQKIGMQIFPGCSTPTDLHTAYKFGLNVVKFFPAEQSGGLAKIKAMSAPFSMLKFMPTGGISLKNLAEYIKNPVIAACGGSYMVTADLIDNGKWDEITDLCKQSVEIVKEARNG